MFDLKPFPDFRGQRFIVRHVKYKIGYVLAESLGQSAAVTPVSSIVS